MDQYSGCLWCGRVLINGEISDQLIPLYHLHEQYPWQKVEYTSEDDDEDWNYTMLMPGSLVKFGHCARHKTATKMLRDAIEKNNFVMTETILEVGGNIYVQMSAFSIAASTSQLDLLKRLCAYNSDSTYAECKVKLEFLLHQRHILDKLGVLAVLLNAGANVNARDHYRPLHRAVEFNNIGAVKLLLSSGADVSAVDLLAITPLHLAARYENRDIFELLLSAGAQVDARDQSGLTSLHVAVEYNNQDAVELLLSAGAQVDARDQSSCTPLLRAVRLNNRQAFELLLSTGADVRAVDKYGKTALHYAVQFKNLEIVELLLAAGADVRAVDKYGRAALHLAVEFKNLDVLELLLSVGADVEAIDESGCTPLHVAVRYNNQHAFEQLLAAGADVRAVDKYGKTALHFAINLNSFNQEIIERLLSLGLKITDCDSSGWTAIHLAAKRDWQAPLKFLIEHLTTKIAKSLGQPEQSSAVMGALADIINQRVLSGRTALHLAVGGVRTVNSLEIIDLLVINGAQLDAADNEGNTPLHSISGEAQADIIDKLIEYGADPDARNKAGETPLHRLECRREALISLSKVNADSSDLNGDTALHKTLKKGCSKWNTHRKLRFLLQDGADITICDTQGKSAAAMMGQLCNRTEDLEYEMRWLFESKLVELDAAGLLTSALIKDPDELEEAIANDPSLTVKRIGCIIELEQLENVQLKPQLSLHDWFTSYRLKRPQYVRDGQLIERLDSIDWQLYPNYGPTMKNLLKTDKHKAKTIAEAEASLARLIDLAGPADEWKRLPTLPWELYGLIVANCNQCELSMFNQAIKRIDKQPLRVNLVN